MTPPIILDHATGEPLKQLSMGGALEGAERNHRETVNWSPPMLSPDRAINGVKSMADARGSDMVRNDGYAYGVSALHKDNIVGSQYRLNAQPNWRALGIPEEIGKKWAEEFQVVVEARFNTVAESPSCYFDASALNTFTGLIRLGVCGWTMTGEVLGTCEWIKDPRRPFKTAIQMISPDRLTNPNGMSDDRFLRRGIRKNIYGQPLSYSIRMTHPSENYDANSFTWKEVPAMKPWGRRQVIHIFEQMFPDQSRGVAEMVSVLKQMKMTKKFQDVVLQNAVINASYAAAIESELPTSDVFAAMGAGGDPVQGMQDYLGAYMGSLSQYLNGASNIQIDGAKIPHFFPGTKLNLQPMGTPGGVGTNFEESLLRHIAAGLGVSYEQLSRDYTKTNYSSARASMNETWKGMQGKKKTVSDRMATEIYALWLEEEINAGSIPLPPGKTSDWFYEPMVKDALIQCSWIGASRGQIDEMKETQAALLRIAGGLSTYEIESARLGKDFREIFEQRERENRMMAERGLTFSTNVVKPNGDNEDNASSPKKKKGEDDQNDGDDTDE